MELTGLLVRYPSGGPLTKAERIRQLKQKKKLDIEPRYQLCVIRMNSTFLESVDKWYGWKGMLSTVSIILLLMFNMGIGFLVFRDIFRALDIVMVEPNRKPGLPLALLMSCVLLIADAFVFWFLKKESFAYTHYPIRFNRKTKMVHVFRTDGTVLSVQWSSLFFTLGHLPQWDEWEIRGHVLEEDGVTIKESFALSYVGSLYPADKSLDCVEPSPLDFVRAHWEFIRRYMEDGPQAVSSQVEFCLPITTRRESFYVGFHRIFANIAHAPWILFLFMAPLCLVFSVSRVFAIRTSKIPRWPADIDATCAIEPGDPYAIEGAADGARIAVFPEAARAAGVAFDAGSVHPPRKAARGENVVPASIHSRKKR